MTCDKYTEWLSAALDGELTAEQRRELDAHLAHCPDCAALFELLSANSRAMREMDCELPEGLHDRIMNNLPPQEAPKQHKVIHWRRWGSLAACLAVVAVLGTAVAAGGFGRMAKSAPEAADPGSAAPAYQAPAENNEAHFYSTSAAPESRDNQGDPNSVNKVEEPQTTEGILHPETTPSAAPEVKPSDNGFGNRTPVPSKLPGIGEGSIIGTFAPTAQYLRVGYGCTPAPSARVISSVSSLEEYLKGFGTNQFDEKGNPVPYKALEQLKETYTDEYFSTRCLVAVVVVSGSGSTRYEVMAVSDDTVNIRTIVPEIGTCDMAAWLIVIELDEMLDDGSTLEVKFNF